MKTVKTTVILFFSIILVSCKWIDDVKQPDFDISSGISIFKNNGKVGITTIRNNNNTISTEFWTDSIKSDSATITGLLPAGFYYRTSINDDYLVSTVYKTTDNKVITYRFNRTDNLNPYYQLYYFKNNLRIKMDTTALGTISSVAISGNDTLLSGYFGKEMFFEAGRSFVATVPFYWNGKTKITKLTLPEGSSFFRGTRAICKSGTDVYVSGLMNFPMYWKNDKPVILSSLFGEVEQIVVAGADVYAVGFYNKQNSNSTNHTACYWKNGTLVALEDGAIAKGIFVDGTDVYVTGAIGRYGAEYHACYWKNGKRTLLKK